MIRLCNLKLIFKIRHSPKPTHYDRRVDLLHIVYQKTVKRCNRDIRHGFRHLFYHTNTFVKRKQRIFCAVIQYTDHQFIHDFCGSLNHIQMSQCKRIKTSGIYCPLHRFLLLFACSGYFLRINACSFVLYILRRESVIPYSSR